MAINPCKECSTPISSDAKTCPSCGAKQKKKKKVLRYLIYFFIFITICSTFSTLREQKNTEKDATHAKQLDGNLNNISNTDKSIKDENWQYETSKDEMRGDITSYAFTTSTNKKFFEFPYNGGSNLRLVLRNMNNDFSIYVQISKGQFVCGYPSCEASFKFDDGAVQSITMANSSTYEGDTLFIKYDKTEKEILNKLRKSKNLIIELPFYQAGSEQFKFNVSGLQWE